jgi:hypothetical protein
MIVPNDANTYLPGVIQIPSSIVITAITKSYPMIVTVSINTVTEANTYIPGQVVRLTIPITYGMWQANGLTPKILSVNGSDLSLDVDSTKFDSFAVPSGNVIQPASLAPSGSRNLEFNNQTLQVPFQSLNNVGN